MVTWNKEVRKAAKLCKRLFLKSALLIFTVSTNAFHFINLFCCFSRYHAPTNSVARGRKREDPGNEVGRLSPTIYSLFLDETEGLGTN